jgi:hypothetical protein
MRPWNAPVRSSLRTETRSKMSRRLSLDPMRGWFEQAAVARSAIGEGPNAEEAAPGFLSQALERRPGEPRRATK